MSVPPYFAPEAYTEPSEAEQKCNRDVAEHLHLLRVRDAAREIHAAERRGAIVLPPIHGLHEFLSVPDEDAQYRIDQLLPMGGRAVVEAQFKSGKTTLVGKPPPISRGRGAVPRRLPRPAAGPGRADR